MCIRDSLYTAHELAPNQARVVANLLLCEGLRGRLQARERLLQVHGFSASEREQHAQQLVEMIATIQARRAEVATPPPEAEG